MPAEHKIWNCLTALPITCIMCVAISLIASRYVYAYLPPGTGQTSCYNNFQVIPCPQEGEDFYGQDANFPHAPLSYKDNGNGTVTDTGTGLVWQQVDDGVQRTWNQAGTYCEALELGGYTDWRMPSRWELLSIVDTGRSNPALNPAFSCTDNQNSYWVTPTYLGYAYYGWFVFAYYGDASGAYKGGLLNVRCVRGAALPRSTYKDNGNGTVTDQTMGLVWEQSASALPMNWQEALLWCQNRSTGGKTDWRLPNKHELEILVDDFLSLPAINPAFFEVGHWYWSSTTNAGAPGDAWRVDFNYGYSGRPTKASTEQYARCVRDGQPQMNSAPATMMMLMAQ